MKRVVLAVALIVSALGLKAQNCDAIVLPYFRGDVARMEEYKSLAPEKFEIRCSYARDMVDVADAVPQSALVFNISELTDLLTGNRLPESFVVDIDVFSFYQYNFIHFLSQLPKHTEGVICFSTPSSPHPYLLVYSNPHMKAEASVKSNQ